MTYRESEALERLKMAQNAWHLGNVMAYTPAYLHAKEVFGPTRAADLSRALYWYAKEQVYDHGSDETRG